MEDGKRGHGSDVMEGILKGVRVLVVREKKKKKRGGCGGEQKGGCSTGTSREVTHPSTIPAQRRLTSEF